MGDLTNDIEELKRTMSVLIEIEKRKLELESIKLQRETLQTEPTTKKCESSFKPPSVSREELKQRLEKDYPFGEIVTFALEQDLIPRTDKKTKR